MKNTSWLQRLTRRASQDQHQPAATATDAAAANNSSTNTAAEAAAATDYEVWTWMEEGGLDLGHDDMVTRLRTRAAVAYNAGDHATYWQLDNVAERLIDQWQDHELSAIQVAVTLPGLVAQEAYLASQQAEIRHQVQQQITPLVDDLDLTTAEPVTSDAAVNAFKEARRLQHQDRVDGDVHRAYVMAVELAHEADEHAAGDEAGPRWVSLTDLRTELAEQARRSGQEPHARQEIDAALQRLAHDEAMTVHVIPEDHEHLLTDADHEAAVRFGGADRHMIRIDYPEYTTADTDSDTDAASGRDQTVQATTDLDDNQQQDDPTDQAGRDEAAQVGVDDADAQSRIGDLLTRSDFAEMNAERLDDADLHAQAAELRSNAEQWRREAQQIAHSSGLGDLFDDDDAAADDAVYDDGDDLDYKSADERFEDSMDALYAQEHADDDAAGDVEDPVPPYLRGKGWLGEPLTEADKAADWRDHGPQQEIPAPGSTKRADKDEAGDDNQYVADQTCRSEIARIGMDGDCAEMSIGHLLIRADEAEMAAERLDDADVQAAELRASAEQWRREARQATRLNGLDDLSDDEDNDDQAKRDDQVEMADQVAEVARDDDAEASVTAETTENADTESASDKAVGEEAAEDVQPVAVTETTACAVAVTRARCSVDRVRQQLDAVEQSEAAERDEELGRWHADDTAAQATTDRARSDSAAQDSATVRE
jgi:hypothetical protein